MAIKSSTGLAAYMMVTGSAKAAFDDGFIRVYSGTEPETADAAETGTLLWTISKDGDGTTGLTFDAAAVGRAMVKVPADTWGGDTTAGTATYWRLVTAADDGEISTTQRRIQGSCGMTAGADMYMTNTTLTTDSDPLAKTLASFSVALPTN
jgi:hypothetical protein